MKKTIRSFFWVSLPALVLSLAIPVAPSMQAQTSPLVNESVDTVSIQTNDAEIDAFVEKMMADKRIPGLSLAVIHDQKLVKAKGYGMLNRERNVKVRPSSVFPIASMSKPLTATAIMLLVEDGKIALDEPISAYLTDAPSAWQAVTVRRILNHTAGLSESIYQSNFRQLTQSDSFTKAAGRIPLDFQPGESWMYSNTGYNLAAALVEAVSEQSFEAFVEERIFAPLGMTATDVVRDSYRSSNIAMGYVANHRGLNPIDVRLGQVRQQMQTFVGSGSITSNVVDLARWAISMQKGSANALQKGQLLSAESLAAMTTPGTTESGLSTSYGLGWFLNDINGHRAVTHGGNLWGYSTSISQFPDNKLTVIVLTNKDNVFGDRLALEIASQYSAELLLDEDSPTITDEQPELTSQLLAYLQGDRTAIEMTPERQIALTNTPRGEYVTNQWQDYVRQHTVNNLELIERSTHANGMKYRYRIITNNDTQILTTVVTPEGLIASIGTGPYSY